MTYPVQCECGSVHQVAATQAGDRFACSCGQMVDVPSLSALKARVGQAAMSAEVRIEQLLGQGRLPLESKCVVCHATTKHVRHCWTTFERAKVDQAFGWALSAWTYLSLFFGTVVFWRRKVERIEGRDRRFHLPIRCCANCVDQLVEPSRLREAMLDVPLYAELLARYPEATLSLDCGLANVARKPDES